MAIFYEQCTLVNRDSKPRSVRYDGQEITLQPGDNPGFPKIAVWLAKEQNPVMGTETWGDPTTAYYWVGVKGVDDCEPLTDIEEGPCRVDHSDLDMGALAPKEVRKVFGRTRVSRFEATQGVLQSGDGGAFDSAHV